MNFKSVNLNETIDKETLIHEKIAPGTSGCFNILLDSNQNLKYKVEFNSLNDKPKNLTFVATKDGKVLGDSDTLEGLASKLIGYINKNDKINILINWYWNFENEQEMENTDIQDTKDSENIKRYEFCVCAIGEEIL